ncbi:MAG TPA: hypothetical protein VGD65_16045 [Chryseosolibacter sp.]
MRAFLILFAAAICSIGCRPEPEAAELVDQLVVSTNYDNTADFSSIATYAIPTDTIGFISETSPDTIIVASKSSFPSSGASENKFRAAGARLFTRQSKSGS